MSQNIHSYRDPIDEALLDQLALALAETRAELVGDVDHGPHQLLVLLASVHVDPALVERVRRARVRLSTLPTSR